MGEIVPVAPKALCALLATLQVVAKTATPVLFCA